MKPFALSPSALASGLFGIAVVVALGVGIAYGLALAVLVLAGGSLGLVLLLLFSSVRNLSGHTPLSLDEALGLGAPTAEEEQKRSLLRALKDLEYERSVGKISEEDYQEFSARYRAEAKRIILQLDDRLAKAQELAEKLAAERVRKAGLDGAISDEEKSVTHADAASDAEAAEALESVEEARSPVNLCDECRTENDADASFCKRCGAALGKPVSPSEEPAREASEEKIP